MPQPAPTQPATCNELMTYLTSLDIHVTTVEHTAVFTVAESEALALGIPGGHTKNLFLKDAKNRLFLVVAEARTIVDLKILHKTLGCARLSFGNADLLIATLGVAPGSVTAFAVLNDRPPRVSVVIDKALMDFAIINCHPLVNTATTAISRADMLRFLTATGHTPNVVQLASSADAPVSGIRKGGQPP